VPGGVGVLLRVDDPDEQVDEVEQPFDLEAMRGLDGVEVRQVQEHQARELAVTDRVPPRDPEPVEQRSPSPAPHGGRRSRGGRAAAARGRELGAGERVEERRLPRSGRACERHDRFLEPEADPCARSLDHRARIPDARCLETAVGELDGVGERAQATVEIVAHRARSTASSAART
jgi:hypothetical protein